MKEKERIEYLPLGSIVILRGGVQKIVINARGLVTATTTPAGYFDYGGSLYPQGIIGDQILYFNHKDIAKIVFTGYTDDDDKMMVDNINEWYENSEFERIDTEEWNRQRRQERGEHK
ncbi:MAG TPA: DUF4176 domain-containing protein [Candidatus Mediterraneibacter faecavium]|uniref:DUF4176 domain-containing protein n=1 Tax=Candidatus Mediterraneibacter faecavium TaxID=2838668 RepID=A0A9D2QA99_9FIRM|nr:DUF4176 domain-containing protein [Candidatus Mediterraneibacter faecavium]